MSKKTGMLLEKHHFEHDKTYLQNLHSKLHESVY